MTRYGLGLDEAPASWATFFDAMKSVGRDFIVRHLDDVTAAELTAADAAGVDHVFAWFISSRRATEGGSAGTADAGAVQTALTNLAISTSNKVYFLVDTDAAGADVDAYFAAIGTAWSGVTRIGVLGGWSVCDYLLTYARVGYAAQTLAWQYGHGWHPTAKLRQVQTGYALNGVDCSKWEAPLAAFGQFQKTEGIEGVAPTTDPVTVSAAPSPLGLVVRANDDLQLLVKDRSGNAMEFRGKVKTKDGGLVQTVSCKDPAADFENIPCSLDFTNTTIGAVIQRVVENPTGQNPTGYVCHVTEPTDALSVGVWPTLKKGAVDDSWAWVTKMQTLLNKFGAGLTVDGTFKAADKTALTTFQGSNSLKADGVCDANDWTALTAATAGQPLPLLQYSCRGKSLATVLSDFQAMTGGRWCMESRAGVWHFWWTHPTFYPTWATLSDSIDFSAESASQYRVADDVEGVQVNVSNEEYANRVRYPASVSPPKLLPGLKDWDQVWTEDTGRWHTYGNGVTIGTGPRVAAFGDASIKFAYTYTAPTTVAVPSYVDLGYFLVPGSYIDMSSNFWGWLYASTKVRFSTNQGIATARIPRSLATLELVFHSGGYPGPSATLGDAFSIKANKHTGLAWTDVKWQMYGKLEATDSALDNGITFDPSNITAVQLRLWLANPSVVTKLTAGHTWTVEFWLDHLHPVGATAKDDSVTTTQYYVETSAVTDGVELPIETRVEDITLSFDDATNLALLTLATASRPKVTVPSLPLVGMVNVPFLSNATLQLAQAGVVGVTYPVSEVTWKPLDSGDVTEVTVGDIPLDLVRKMEDVAHHLDRWRAQK